MQQAAGYKGCDYSNVDDEFRKLSSNPRVAGTEINTARLIN